MKWNDQAKKALGFSKDGPLLSFPGNEKNDLIRPEVDRHMARYACMRA